jgi:hypothetical protein
VFKIQTDNHKTTIQISWRIHFLYFVDTKGKTKLY